MNDPAVMSSHIPSIFKQLKKIMRYETSITVNCYIPELYYQICMISMEYPIPGITVPLIVNEFFALFQREESEIRSCVCRNCSNLFSEFVFFSECLRYRSFVQWTASSTARQATWSGKSHSQQNPKRKKRRRKRMYTTHPTIPLRM